jgi:hypothetical protein
MPGGLRPCSARGARDGPSLRHPTKPPITMCAIPMPSPATGRDEKPHIAVPRGRPFEARRPSALIPRGARMGQEMHCYVKRPVTLRVISLPCQVNGGLNTPRSVGPRGGDLALRLCGLWWPNPNETEAKRPRLPNRRAGGRPFEARRPSALAPRLARGASDAPPHNATHHHVRDTYAFSSDRARETPRSAGTGAAVCSLGGRGCPRPRLSRPRQAPLSPARSLPAVPVPLRGPRAPVRCHHQSHLSARAAPGWRCYLPQAA